MRVLYCFAVCSLLAAGSASARADDFRIATKIFQGKEENPVAENLTLFSGGLVYDFLLTPPEEISILDAQRGRFLLLNVPRRRKTSISTDAVLQFVARMKVRAATERDSFLRFMADPAFDESYDRAGQTLTLAGKPMTYRVQAEPADNAQAARQYREFADWYARLNATRFGGRPPFARLQLNQALGDRGLVPTEVALSIPPRNRLTGRAYTVRSHHIVTWRLLPDDRKRIARAGAYLAQFKRVEFFKFREAEQGAASKADKK